MSAQPARPWRVIHPDQQPAARRPPKRAKRKLRRPAGLTPQATLGEFYANWDGDGKILDSHYGRRVLEKTPYRKGRARSWRTIAHYDTAVRRWIDLTGDPPLEDIDPLHVAEFLEKAVVLDRSMETVRGYCRALNMLFRLTGRQTFRQRYGANLLLTDVPWIEAPAKDSTASKRAYRLEELYDLIRAGRSAMDWSVGNPLTWPVPVTVFWPTLLTVAYNTGLRRGTLFLIDWPMIEGKWIDIPKWAMKCSKPLRLYLNRYVLAALENLPRKTRRIFPWAACPKTFDRHFLKLCEQAWGELDQEGRLPSTDGNKLGEKKNLGMQAIRRTCNTQLKKIPGGESVCRLVMNHGSLDVNDRHYTDAIELMPDVLEALRQPTPAVQKHLFEK